MEYGVDIGEVFKQIALVVFLVWFMIVMLPGFYYASTAALNKKIKKSKGD